MKQINYPKIPQFRNVVSSIKHSASYVGQDDNGDPIYNGSIRKPILTARGTVKIHGTNAGVCYNAQDGIYTQSRNNPFDIEKCPDSHMGFTFFVKKNISIFEDFFNNIANENNIDTTIDTISIYGEWAGSNIQKGVAVSELGKKFYIFGVKISRPSDPEFTSYWLPYSHLDSNENEIYNIDQFGVYEVEVDFEQPGFAQQKFHDLTMEVEKECPVGKFFDVSGVGEGLVWTIEYKGSVHKFKTKGELHSVSKVKKVAAVDVEKLNSINEFIEYSVTENRFEQAIQQVFPDSEPTIKQMGDLIRWFVNDIMSEEIDVMTENNLEPKDVNKYISTKVRGMFQAFLNEKAGL